MPVPVRDAATLMLVRDSVGARARAGGQSIVEVCMLRRNLASEFVAGAYVFPGGSVDPDDRGLQAENLCLGRSDADASRVLGVDSGGLGFWVAALRESFEEAGVMLAVRRDSAAGRKLDPAETLVPSELLDTSDPRLAARFAAYRDAVNAGSMRLLDVCRQEDLALAVGDVHCVSHWITPELAPRRYDTRFFVAAAPPGQVATHDDGETIAAIWVRPADALARHQAGEIDLLPPTIANLEALQPHRTSDEVMAWARSVSDVPAILPLVLVEDGHVLILRPGDDGYEEALADRLTSGPDPAAELQAAARWLWGPRAAS
ncbi:MAG: NUDIX hydrolase [Acidimicrobiales bacterium]